jgi:hypothetical protein
MNKETYGLIEMILKTTISVASLQNNHEDAIDENYKKGVDQTVKAIEIYKDKLLNHLKTKLD